MKKAIGLRRAAVTVTLVVTAATTLVAQPIVIHFPRLNWDFFNFTGQQVNDLAIIVESPKYVPQASVIGMPFPTLTVTHGDYIPWHAGDETKVEWSGAWVHPNELAHIGLDMNGAGRILDAYWTLNGAKVGPSIAISYELTEVRRGSSGAIHMQMQIAPGWFEDHPGGKAGWENVRTFVNIPSSRLSLQDINRSLDLSTLGAFEVTPQAGVPGYPGNSGNPLPSPLLMSDGDSFFDIFLAVTEDEYLNQNFQSLLVADVLNQGQVIGRFWNLNYQSPEPSTVSIIGLAGAGTAIGIIRRIRRKKNA